MKLDIREKKVLYAYGCPDYHNTVTRLKWLVSLTVDRETRHWLLRLARKMETEGSQEWYPCFYYHLRMEMGGYFRAEQFMKEVEVSTECEKDINRHLFENRRETIVNFNELEQEAVIYTFNGDLKQRLAEFGKKYPLLCCLVESTPEGSETYVLDKSRLSIRLVPPSSEECRAVAREYAKKHGFQTVQTDQETA